MNSLRHVGIIMDGNGRWAQQRGKSRMAGHSEGVRVSKEIVRRAAELGLPFLSLYVFSRENWKRPPKEIEHLLGLLQQHLRNELQFYIEHGIRVWHSGDMNNLPQPVQEELSYVIEQTKRSRGLTVNLLINYGGQQEIIEAADKLSKSGQAITAEALRENFYHGKELPPMDFLIRAGGDQRISNFLLWDAAYAELYFSETLWPDWSVNEFDAALGSFDKRIRRFGAVPPDKE